MPEPKLSWSQNICERCWFEKEPDRFPVHLRRPDPEDYTVGKCAYCGTPTISRIYVRDDPKNVMWARVEEPEPEEPEDAPSTDIRPSVVLDLLSLVEDEVPGPMPTLIQVQVWSPLERVQVGMWAGALHLRASDNDDVVIPETPDILKEH